jgi:hypothetical protein
MKRKPQSNCNLLTTAVGRHLKNKVSLERILTLSTAALNLNYYYYYYYYYYYSWLQLGERDTST